MEGRKNGFNDIIHALPDGTLTETSIANLFFVKDGILITAPEHLILPGITRKVVMQLAQGIPLEERALHQTELAHVSECFITSSNREIMPISRIDALTLPVGPITRFLMEKFKTYTFENNHMGTLN